LWQSLSAHFFKINYDTAIRDTLSTQAAICKDSRGYIIKYFSPYTLIFGEALPALLANHLAIPPSLSHFILEGD
jgi:hypothetical protein